MSSSNLHSPEEIREAAMAVGNALARCENVDFVVPRGGTSTARQLLRASPNFEVEERTNHTTYKAESLVEIEILAPPALFNEPFDQKTELITVLDTKVLKPALLLNANCGAVTGRATEEKKRTDLFDITFLLNFCARNPQYLPKTDEVPKATKELVHSIIQLYGGQDAWERAGYDLETGCFTRA